MDLGLPIGAKPRSTSLWDLVIEKFRKKCQLGRKKYLSLRGRTMIIKGALTNIPVYYMSLFKMLKAVVERVDRIRRNILWEGRGEKKKISFN